MNEDRYRNILNISGKPDDHLEEDWQDLQVRLQTLENRVRPLYRGDVLSKIIKQKIVLRNNKPSKKVYKSVLKITQGLEKIVNDLGGRAR